MADFFQKLADSIFTPGPTATLLLATNYSFAALETVLLLLLLFTWSIHFVVLSMLAGALWWAINWFANELAEQTRHQELTSHLSGSSPGAWRGAGGTAGKGGGTAGLTLSQELGESVGTLMYSSAEEEEDEEGRGTGLEKSDGGFGRRRQAAVREKQEKKFVEPDKLAPASRLGVNDGMSEMSGTEDEWEKVSGSGILEK